MLVGPPPKSRSFFSFLSRDFRKTPEEQFDDDPEWIHHKYITQLFTLHFILILHEHRKLFVKIQIL